MESETEMKVGNRVSDAEMKVGKRVSDAEMEMGKRESDAEMETMKGIVYLDEIRSGWETDSVKLQLDMALIRVAKEAGSLPVEIRRKVLSEGKRRAEKVLERLPRKKGKRRVRNSGGKVEDKQVQRQMQRLNQLSIERKVLVGCEVDSAMGNSKEGHTPEVDLALENSKEGLTWKGKEVKKEKKLQNGLAKHNEWRRKKNEEEMQRASAKYEEWRRKVDEELLRQQDPEEITDPYAYQARLFEKRWNSDYLTGDSRFEDNTSIPCKRYTFDPAPDGGFRRNTLQVFSVKVTELTGGLQWPLNVFGLVALRDSLDHNRNVIFKRERDNCQTLTSENPYLLLTGPVRGVVFSCPVVFEVLLYVRGTTESDDKELSLLAVDLIKSTHPLNSVLIKESYTSRLSTLDVELGHIVYSVEATISVKVISGPPTGFYGEFVASTDGLKREVLLHSSGVEELHLAGDEINLSRSVVSVEGSGKLMVSVRASDGSVTLTGTKEFEALEKGITTSELHIPELCLLEITVAWSLFAFART